MRVIIMQGVPGSGKSTWAKAVKVGPNVMASKRIVSADHYFEDSDGNYNFDPSKLGKAHADCMLNFLTWFHRVSPTHDDVIVVDNTNVTKDQMSPYYLVARAHGASVEIVRVQCDPKVAASRNSHGVPEWKVANLAKAMEDPPKFWDVKFRKVG